SDPIRPDLIHVLVCTCRDRSIAAAEVQRAGPWNRDLRPAIRVGFEKCRVGRIDRMGPPHTADDSRDRLCPASALAAAADGVGAADSVDAQMTKRAITVIGATAEFAIGDKFEP